MKKNLFLSSMACLLLLQSCASGVWIWTKPSGNKTSYAPDKNKYEKNYIVGTPKTVFIGQEIIKVKQYTQHRGVSIEHFSSDNILNIDAKYRLTDYEIKSESNKQYQPNETLNIAGEIYYLIKFLDTNKTQWGVFVSANGLVFRKAIYSYDWEMIFFPATITFKPDNFKFSVKTTIIDEGATPAPISFEIIYTGKNDISLNFTYREFTAEDLARPAFFQNLTYQANAKQIRFKDFVIQIHNVSNEQITYTIIEDGLK